MKYKCEKCGADTHRDDAMNSRCNGCEWLVRECICEAVMDEVVAESEVKHQNRNQRKGDYAMGKNFTPPPTNPGPNPDDRSKRNDPPPGKTDRRGDGRDNLPPERPKK